MASNKRLQRSLDGASKSTPSTSGATIDCPVQVNEESFENVLLSPPKRQNIKSESPTAHAFLTMILHDITTEEKSELSEDKKPTVKQIQYADSLGLEMDVWDGCSMQTMSQLLSDQKEWHAEFKSANNDYAASGFVKECLRANDIEFDANTLTRKRSILLLKSISKGATVDTMRQLRHLFRVPLDILLKLTESQAQKVLKRMTIERDNGGLSDVARQLGSVARSL